jgi:aminoglycoside/choline kinase family phosphotransferase
MNDRQELLHHWLKNTSNVTEPMLHALTSDASFRRYFRFHQSTGDSYIVMDAPPEKENCVPYVAISRALRSHGLLTPEVFAEDISQGFLLLSDFGDRVLLNELNPTNAPVLYTQAVDALAVLQSCPEVIDWQVPCFTADFMYKELKLFQEWYLKTHLALSLSTTIENKLDQLFIFLAETAASQPQVFMHRDYHSANLMVLPDNQLGILDFQDAFIGPVTYDLVSLLRDCYIAWPEQQVITLALHYRDQLKLTVSDNAFLRWFDLMGLQRHLKALLTFSRKYHRDGNAHYLKHIPRTLNYITQESKNYFECQAFHSFLHDVIIPTQQRMIVCAE